MRTPIMPKLRMETEAQIRELIEQGYKNVEIVEKLKVDRKTVAKRRKEYLKQKQEEEKSEPEQDKIIPEEQKEAPPLDQQIYTRIGEGALSDSAMHRLYQLHTLLGSNSIEAMIETVYSDYVVADKLWLEYKDYPDVSKTFAWVIDIEQGYSADLRHDLDISMKDQELIEKLKVEAEEQYEEGYQKGKNDHALLVPCVSCGESITLTPGNETHRLIGEFLRKGKIVHNNCMPRYRRIYA